MSAIAPGTKFKLDGVEYKVLRHRFHLGAYWSCLYYQKNSGLTKTFSEQEILEALG